MDNLSQNIQRFFLEQYQGLDSTTTFLAFEPLGCIINPEEYRDPATHQFVLAKADEDIAEIVDRVPEISDAFIPGLNQVSTQYATLVNGATFNEAVVQAPDIASYLALLGKLKGEALKTLADADRMSVVNASGKYFPVTTVPGTWYDAQSPIWASKEFKADAVVAAPTPANEPPEPIHRINLVWRNIVPDNVNPRIRQLADTGAMGRTLLNIKGLHAAGAAQEPPPPTGLVSTGLNGPGPALTTVLQPRQRMAMPLRTTRAALLAPQVTVAASAPSSAHAALLNRLMLAKPPGSAPLAQSALALRTDFTRLVLDDSSATETKPVESSNLAMSFDYCVVQVHRFWFDTNLFNYPKLWYAQAQVEDCYSNGAKDSSNRGTLKAIPKAFIIIKDLKISASWSAHDLHDAQNSVGLGFFNLLNSSVNGSNQLVNPSLQIIGWLCEVPPKLPLVNDPRLAG